MQYGQGVLHERDHNTQEIIPGIRQMEVLRVPDRVQGRQTAGPYVHTIYIDEDIQGPVMDDVRCLRSHRRESQGDTGE